MSQTASHPDPEFQALARSRYAGDPHALAELGLRLLVGRDAPHAPVDGAALVSEAAKHGDAAAWRFLAVAAASGVGRPQSWPDAFDALARAADLGDAPANRQFALLREMRIGRPDDARSWLSTRKQRVVHESPRFLAFPEFLPREICSYLVDRAKPKLVPAQVNDARGGGLKLDPMRTNTTAVFSLIDADLVLQLVRTRIAAAAGVPLEHFEPAEVLHYSVGERYKPHVDFFHPTLPNFAEEMRLKGQRVKTCLVYLNDDFEGGETEFTKIDVKFRGSTGEALMFENVLSNGTGDMNTVHTGLPPTQGEKWLLSQWIRSKAQRMA